MTESGVCIWTHDREHAGRLQGKKYKRANVVVVGIPLGGVCVAATLAAMLSLPLEVMLWRKINHPTDSKKNIGSVGADEAFIHDCPYGVPQDYTYKTVILVDDVLQSSDTMIA